MIVIKTPEQIDNIRRSADLLSAAFQQISGFIGPGMTSLEIDRIVRGTIEKGGGVPAFLNYDGFPASVCTSHNDQVIHGIPNDIPWHEGDIISCDIGVILDGYYSDACKTFNVGTVSTETRNLLDITSKSLYSAIEACKPGCRLGALARAVMETASVHKYGIVKSFCGHGIGLELHEDPQIPNYYPARGSNIRLKPGMVIAIEPMINSGSHEVQVLEDGWTVVTADGSLSAHFEHTVLITENGAEILTHWS